MPLDVELEELLLLLPPPPDVVQEQIKTARERTSDLIYSLIP